MRCYHMITLKNGMIVPCGKCPACLSNLRQEWVFRLKQEYLNCVFAIFVTLTYDDDHLPNDLSVNKEDVQKFHKRLRKHFPSKDLRYYLVSEYGDHTFRPHYHGLYFFKSKYTYDFVYQAFLDSWKSGFIKFGEVEEGSIVYCTKYCLKHSQTPIGRKPTFRLVSKMNGGIGYNYLDKMNDFHVQTLNLSFVSANGKLCRMPHYYKKKLQFDCSMTSQRLSLLKDQFEYDSYYNELKRVNERFASFLKSHKGLSFQEACSQFNQIEQHSHDERDRLILAHTKKQKF